MRTARYLFLVLGLVSATLCFFGLSAEALPYQDPTPEMLAEQERGIRWWLSGLLAGSAIAVLAAIAIWRSCCRGQGS